ncbi:MAG TPA: SPOR domain-containing protein [Albitalea sp.]|nr:SPOR domain-containing protein [Albitalea sp.]
MSIFRSKASKASKKAPGPSDPDAVQTARTRARRRLIGAVVLVVAGVVGFPLLFETQPRPIPVDIPIEIPKKEGAAPLAMPAARPRPVVVTPAEPVASAAAPEIITETRADAGREVPVAARPASAAAPAAAPSRPVATAAAHESARAQALLEGKPVLSKVEGAAELKASGTKDGARYIVQVGAFADAVAARETRSKVEKLGLKTYTQVAETSAGQRIRVRVGPFTSREEADRAMAKAKSAGVAAVVLTL